MIWPTCCADNSPGKASWRSRGHQGLVQVDVYDVGEDAAFLASEPARRIDARLGDRLSLVGLDLQTAAGPGGQVSLRLYWRGDSATDVPYKAFVHLLDPDGAAVAQDDAEPQGGAWATTRWLADETVVDDYSLVVPGDAAAGEYSIAVGMYDPSTMVRLSLYDARGERQSDDQLIVDGLEVRANYTDPTMRTTD